MSDYEFVHVIWVYYFFVFSNTLTNSNPPSVRRALISTPVNHGVVATLPRFSPTVGLHAAWLVVQYSCNTLERSHLAKNTVLRPWLFHILAIDIGSNLFFFFDVVVIYVVSFFAENAKTQARYNVYANSTRGWKGCQPQREVARASTDIDWLCNSPRPMKVKRRTEKHHDERLNHTYSMDL